jgi:hypothetical protein
MGQKRTSRHSLDNLVGAGDQAWWNSQTKRFRRPEVDRQFVFRRCLHWQLGWPLAFENAIYVRGRTSPMLL